MQFYQVNDVLTITRSNELVLKNTTAPFDLSGRTDGLVLSSGTTAQRPANPATGLFRINTTLFQPEIYTATGWSTIDIDFNILQAATPTTLSNVGDMTTVTGQGFVPGMVFEFVGSTDAIYLAPSWSLINPTTVVLQRPNVLPQSEEPFSIRVTMPNGPQHTLRDIIEVGEAPFFVSPPTPAAGSFGSFASGCNITPITIQVADADPNGSILSITANNISASGLSFTQSTSNTAVISGTTTNLIQATTTYNITVSAIDSGSNVTSRNYSLTVLYTPLAITSAQPQSISANTSNVPYTATYTYTANKVGVAWSLASSSPYATINAQTGVLSVNFAQGVTAVGAFTITASWGLDSTSQTLSYNVYNFDLAAYPSGPWAILDVVTLASQANNSAVESWGVLKLFSQPVSANRPTYVSSGGYNNTPYVFFNRTNSTFLDAGSQTLSVSTQGGFTLVCMIKWTGTVGGWERIIDFGSGSGNNNIVVTRYSNTANITLDMYNSSTSYAMTTSTSPIVANEWMVIACRWIKGSKRQIYKNNVLVLENTFTTTINDRTVTNTYLGKSNWAADAYLNAHISKTFIYDRALSDNEMSLLYAKCINAPAITLRPSNISQDTAASSYTVSYTFTGVASAGTISWSISPKAFGTINGSSGALTLFFDRYTTASGTLTVTATDANGSSTYSWTYAITNVPTITSVQPANISQSTATASYTVSYSFTANQPVTWSINNPAFGDINASTGALTILFPLYTTASDTFIVTATNDKGYSKSQSWTYAITNVPTITSAQPANINENTETSAYVVSYTFSANQPVTWSINTTAFGNINASTGALSLTFGINTVASGTFVVTATNAQSYSTTQSWSYIIRNTAYATSIEFYPTATQPMPLTYATGTTQADGTSLIRVNDNYLQLVSVQSGSLRGMYAYLYWSDVSLGSRFQVMVDVMLTGTRGGFYADAFGIFAYGTAEKTAANTDPGQDTGGYQVYMSIYDYVPSTNQYTRLTRGSTVLYTQANDAFPKETWTPVVMTFNDGAWTVTVNSVTFLSYTDASQPSLYSNTYFGIFGAVGYDETNIRIRNLRVNQI